jgi:hypothetical protein
VNPFALFDLFGSSSKHGTHHMHENAKNSLGVDGFGGTSKLTALILVPLGFDIEMNSLRALPFMLQYSTLIYVWVGILSMTQKY